MRFYHLGKKEMGSITLGDETVGFLSHVYWSEAVPERLKTIFKIKKLYFFLSAYMPCKQGFILSLLS